MIINLSLINHTFALQNGKGFYLLKICLKAPKKPDCFELVSP